MCPLSLCCLQACPGAAAVKAFVLIQSGSVCERTSPTLAISPHLILRDHRGFMMTSASLLPLPPLSRDKSVVPIGPLLPSFAIDATVQQAACRPARTTAGLACWHVKGSAFSCCTCHVLSRASMLADPDSGLAARSARHMHTGANIMQARQQLLGCMCRKCGACGCLQVLW